VTLSSYATDSRVRRRSRRLLARARSLACDLSGSVFVLFLVCSFAAGTAQNCQAKVSIAQCSAGS